MAVKCDETVLIGSNYVFSLKRKSYFFKIISYPMLFSTFIRQRDTIF